VLFLGAFYLVLIGSEVAVAGVLHAGRDRLVGGHGYAVVLRVSAVLLLVTGGALAVEGLETLR
jgi:hypothetical protein